MEEDTESDTLLATQPVDNRVLKNVVAYVEVRSTNDNRSEAVEQELEQLGAVVVKKFTNDVTHVIFKEGNNRTKTKAHKKNVHLVSVLWVDSCKRNQEHVSERLYPAFIPKQKERPIFIPKMKKAKSMQPRDFDQELANSTERVNRKKKKLERLIRLHSSESSTPYSSPQGHVLVHDTQPRSAERSLLMTPVRLNIPETPPSMRERLRILRAMKEASACSTTENETSDDAAGADDVPLQRKLFSCAVECEFSSTSQSSVGSSGANPADDTGNDTIEEEADDSITDSPLTKDLLKIAQKIKKSLSSSERRKSVSQRTVVGEEVEKASMTKLKSPRESSQQLFNADMSIKDELSDEKVVDDTSVLCVDRGEEQIKAILHREHTPSETENPLLSASSAPKSDTARKVRRSSRQLPRNQEPSEIGDSTSIQHVNTKQEKQPAEREKKRKRKLLAVTDMCDPPSILMEPTKCSQYEREVLGEEKKTSRGRKKRCSPGTSSQKVEKGGEETQDKSKVHTKKSKQKRKVDSHSKESHDNHKAEMSSDIDSIQTSQALVNDTVSEETTDCSRQVLTSLNRNNNSNITRQNSSMNSTCGLSVSQTGKDYTLGLSMSTAYTDSTLPSFLRPSRRSVEEFSQQHREKARQKRDVTVGCLPTVLEKENIGLTEDQSVSSTDRTYQQKVRPSLVMTSLHSHEQDVVISVVKKLGGFMLTENVNETTTHLVCGEYRRTLNIINGLARGVWLLSKEWVIKSLEASKWLPEEPFECQLAFPMCKVARLEREKGLSLYRQTLFQDSGLIYVSGRSVPPRNKIVSLIKLCGGQVTRDIKKAQMYLGSDLHPGVLCVKVTWLLDCITEHTVLAYDVYRLDRPKRESSPVY